MTKNGRKGSPNRVGAELRAMILGALDDSGGRAYLVKQAADNPATFLALLGKIIPREVQAELEGRLTLSDLGALARLEIVDGTVTEGECEEE